MSDTQPEQAPEQAPAPRGWSKASRRRGADLPTEWMRGIGVDTPAGAESCHYCGLDPETCDCR